MYRKIGEVAELLGITTSAIRKYEEKGILKSKRQEGNEYRQYDVHDISKFFWIRVYKSLGFSINEAMQILHNSTMQQITELIEKQQERIAEEILHRQRIIHILQQTKDNIKAAGSDIRIEYMPEFYYFEYMRNYKIISDERLMEGPKASMRHIPYSAQGFYFEKDKINDMGESLDSVGMLMRKNDAERWGLTEYPGVIHFPSRLCFTCVIESEKANQISMEQLKPVLDQMRMKGMPPSGSIVGEFILCMYKANGAENYKYYSKLWIPID